MANNANHEMKPQETNWDSLDDALKAVPEQFRQFSLIMRGLYGAKMVSGKTKEGQNFNKVRNNIRDDALIYKRQLFPVVEDFIVKLRDFIDNYITLDYEDWVEDLEGIYKEVCEYEQGSEALRSLHENLVAKFKKHEDNLDATIEGMEAAAKHYGKLMKELKEKADSAKGWAIGLAFVPVVGLIASPILAKQAVDLVKKYSAEEQNNLARVAACETAKTGMLPALEAITEGLSTIQSFFGCLKQELAVFALGGENALAMKKNGESPSKRHFKKTRKKGEAIDKTCQLFAKNIEPVKSDLEALPTDDANMNYIDTWLQTELEKHPKGSTMKAIFKKISPMFRKICAGKKASE